MAKRWRRKTWWLARYFELSVPMTFMLCVLYGLRLILRRGMTPGIAIGAVIGLVYVAMLREIVERTWRWQASEWLAGIKNHLTQEEAMRMEAQIEEKELELCRVWSLVLVAAVMVLVFLKLPVITMIMRVVTAMMVGSLIVSHALMACVLMRKEIAEIWHSL